MQVVPFPPRPSSDAPLLETPHTRAYLVAPGATWPAGSDVILQLPDGARFAYVPTAAGPGPAEVTIDPFVRGNSFKPLHDSPRALSALLSIAAARRVDTGPESERVFVFLRGSGLVFEENGDTHRFEPNTVCLAPAGEPARVWAQGPEDVLAIVLQPKGQQAERRTLKSEIAKKRATQA